MIDLGTFNAATGKADQDRRTGAVKGDQARPRLATCPSRDGSSTWKAGPSRGHGPGRIRSLGQGRGPESLAGRPCEGEPSGWRTGTWTGIDKGDEKPARRRPMPRAGSASRAWAPRRSSRSRSRARRSLTRSVVVTRRIEPFPPPGFTNAVRSGTQTIYGADFTFAAAWAGSSRASSAMRRPGN